MELPHIGQHCSQSSCKQLDFLPMKCDACNKIFCRDHIVYVTHACPESYRKDNQIPVCPLCNRPCPLMKGELPDVVVGRHIESDCQSDPAKERRKIYTNRCSKKGCKRKELIPVSCETCHQNYCLRHRHENDHDCQGFQGTGRGVSRAGAAALRRSQQSVPSPVKKPSPSNIQPGNRNQNSASSAAYRQDVMSSLQNGMGEDEALARALQLSMVSDSDASQTEAARKMKQEEEDSLLAQAISMSEQETTSTRATQNRHHQTSTEKCAVQ